jgi:hypothetical protein
MSTKIILELGLGLRVYFALIQVLVEKNSWRAFISSTFAQVLNLSGISGKRRRRRGWAFQKALNPF